MSVESGKVEPLVEEDVEKGVKSIEVASTELQSHEVVMNNYFRVKSLYKLPPNRKKTYQNSEYAAIRFLGKIVSHTATLIFISLLILIDLVFFFLMVTKAVEHYLSHLISQIIVSLFMVELILRCIVFWDEFRSDLWTVLDGIVIICSFVMDIFFEDVGSLLIILRFFRVTRIAMMIMIRSDEARARLRSKNKTPLEDIVHKLQRLLVSGSLTPEEMDDVSDVVHALTNEQLYNPRLIISDSDAKDVEMREYLDGFTNNEKKSIRLNSKYASQKGLLLDASDRLRLSKWVLSEKTEPKNLDEVKCNNDNDKNNDENDTHLNVYSFICESQVRDLLNATNKYDFNIFLLESYSNNNSLCILGYYFFFHFDLFSQCQIDPLKLKEFLYRIQEGYIKENLYHNATHAADVLQTLKYILIDAGMYERFNFVPLDMVAVFIAAAAHDYGHPGLTNKFLSDTQHDWALQYNDISVSENYHAASVFRMLQNSKCNITENFSNEDKNIFRTTVISCIMGTDMAKHFEDLGKFKVSLLSTGGEPKHENPEDRLHLLRIALHACDISAQTKKLHLAKVWGSRCVEEFFLQGDKEKELGMQVSPMFSREHVGNVGKSQRGFIQYIVLPLFEAIAPSMLNETDANMILSNINSNQDYWDNLTDYVPQLNCESSVEQGSTRLLSFTTSQEEIK